MPQNPMNAWRSLWYARRVFGLANRALTRGKNPGGLLLWLLKRQKDEFITQADDDAAQKRWQPHQSKLMGLPKRVVSRPKDDRGLTEDELFVEGCIRGVKRHRGIDPFLVAERGKGWTRKRWELTRCSYERKQARQGEVLST